MRGKEESNAYCHRCGYEDLLCEGCILDLIDSKLEEVKEAMRQIEARLKALEAKVEWLYSQHGNATKPRCPSCNSPMRLYPSLDLYVCPYCGNALRVAKP